MGLGSLTESGSSSTSSPPAESVNGLKFGKKIYFEDAGAGTPAKSGPGSSSSSGSGVPAKKVHGGQQQPPRCQVEGCKVDLSDAKAYYSRHKVCGMHSKSPVVTVAGLEQRFCQQCSRFHQLPEFDQGKRSCRRRLAGHNERRRKPPRGSVLSSRYSRLSSSIFEDNSSRVGGIVVDFNAYPRPTGRDAFPTVRLSERVPGNQTMATERPIPHLWQYSSQNLPPNHYLQCSAGGTVFSSPGIPSGECFNGAGITDSTCALSLLSNQPWGSRNRASSLGVNDMVNTHGAPVPQSTASHGATVNQFPNLAWGFKGNDSSSYNIHPHLGLGQISQPLNGQFSGELELSQQNRRHYMDLDQSRADSSSTQNIHWSL